MDACAGIAAKPSLDNPASYDFTLNKTSALEFGGVDGLDAANTTANTTGSATTTVTEDEDGGDDNAAGKIAAAAVVGSVGSALLTAALMAVFYHRRERSLQGKNQQLAPHDSGKV